MFTQKFRISITAVLVISMTTLSLPAGSAHAALSPADEHVSGPVIPTTGKEFKSIAETAIKVKTETAMFTAEELTPLTKIFGTAPVRSKIGDAWTSNSIPPSSGHTISYYDKDGNYLGKKVVTDSSTGTHTETYYDKNGKKIYITEEQAIKPPVRPPDTEKNIGVWTQYYKDYVAYIGKLDSVTAKKTAWESLGKDILKMSKEHPELITASAMNAIIGAMTGELKKIYKDAGNKLDVSGAQKDIVDAALNFIKSDSFKKMDDATQSGVAWNFTLFAIELSWSSKNNTQNSALYPKIGEFFKTMLGNGSTAVKAQTFSMLVHLYCTDAWSSKERNADVANQILKDALKVSGGLSGLMNTWMDNINNSSLSADERGKIAHALALVAWQHEALNTASSTKVTDAQLTQISQKLTTFIKGVNDGSINISANIRGGLINSMGCALATLIGEGKYTSDESKALGNAFIAFAHDSLLLSADKGGSVSLQTGVINILTSLITTANAKGIADVAQKCKDTLLNKDFDVAGYVAKAAAEMKTAANADYAAWVNAALANLAKINLENKTGKIGSSDIIKTIGDIKAWLADPDHLKDMRIMGWQKFLYESLADLMKEVYAKSSTIGADKGLQDNIVALFGTISGLQDSTVKELTNKDLGNLVTGLKANGFKELACRLEMLSCPDSASLMAKAWSYYTAKDYESGILFANECIKRCGLKASEQQASLKGFAAAGKESTYWALNDVGTAHFILGEIYKAQGNKTKAKEEYNTVIAKFGYAQCYDTKGWYWKVAEAAKKSLDSL